tara:strand:+ start:45 stop:263 length:219 start_codon:yes stop_codon:yes gene_type:complete
MYSIDLTANEIDILRTILLDDIEKDGFDTPDYADVDLMEAFTYRAAILQKVIQIMSCRSNELSYTSNGKEKE